MSPVWPWVLTAVGATSLYLAGRRSWTGWALGLAGQVLWLSYALVTRQWGFVASAAIYGWVNARNLRAWLRDARRPVEAPDPSA